MARPVPVPPFAHDQQLHAARTRLAIYFEMLADEQPTGVRIGRRSLQVSAVAADLGRLAGRQDTLHVWRKVRGRQGRCSHGGVYCRLRVRAGVKYSSCLLPPKVRMLIYRLRLLAVSTATGSGAGS